MASLKSLAKDTAIYGMSSIVGRFLNYLLVPLYTNVIPAQNGGYGIVTELYAYVAFCLVVLTFGMETTYFRFANKEGENPHQVFHTAFSFVSCLAIAFFLAIWLFINPIGEVLGYQQHHDYILIMAMVVALDAIQALPFCLLRYKKRPIKFASLKLLFVCMNIGLNLFYFLVLEHKDVWGVFALNLLCTGLITFFFIPDVKAELSASSSEGQSQLLKRMLSYSWPILVLGIAGILNQTFDKMAFRLVYDSADGDQQLGIYGGCVKIAMIMAMITQAFRYAYEPFVFAQNKDKDKKEMYAAAMKYFIIFTLLAFVAVMAYMPILQLIIGPGYRAGLRVVPIVMVAEIMMGVYFNLSFWYKLIDKTIWGAWFSGAGCLMLVMVNVLFIPEYSYMACAWGGVAGYGTAMVLSYFVGQHYYPIRYPLGSIFGYVILTAILYVAIDYSNALFSFWTSLVVNTFLVGIFLAYLVLKDARKLIKR